MVFHMCASIYSVSIGVRVTFWWGNILFLQGGEVVSIRVILEEPIDGHLQGTWLP